MTEVRFHRIGQWFSGVPVTINGEINVSLLVDTGASTSSIDRDSLSELGLSGFADGRARDAFSEYAIETALVPSLRLGLEEIKELRVMLTDAVLAGPGTESVAGYLGHDVLDQFCVTFDLKSESLLLEASGSCGSLRIPCLCDESGWFVSALLGAKQIRLQLDTGAGISCLRKGSIFVDDLKPTEKVVRATSPNGQQDCPVGRLSELLIDEVLLRDVEFAIGEFDLDDGAGGFVDGLLGVEILGALRWTVDAKSGTARFASA